MEQRKSRVLELITITAIALVTAGCSGKGSTGTQGEPGPQGPPGSPGPSATFPPGSGLGFAIQSATVAADGSATVTFRTTDAAGNDIDLLSEMAAGTLSPRFVLSERDPTTGVYKGVYEGDRVGSSYKDATGATVPPAVPSAVQALPAANPTSSNVRRNADGTYVYTFAPPPPSGSLTAVRTIPHDLTKVHTVAIYGQRTFGNVPYPAFATYDFVPATGAAATTREVVSDAACNTCHQNLTAHGQRRGVVLCLTCHSPQTVDPETNESTDFRVMIHRIHAGQTGYKIVGFNQGIADYSGVKFAPHGQDVRNCVACHQGADADHWKTTPNIAACGSCHTEVNFATGAGHLGGPQGNDAACAGCHTPTEITQKHSPAWDGVNKVLFDGRTLEISIDSVTGPGGAPLAAGAPPVIKFTVKVNGAPHDVTQAPLQQLRFTIAGPTTDYSGAGSPDAVNAALGRRIGYYQLTPVQSGATANVVFDPATGQCTYAPAAAATTTIDAGAAGTVAVGVEAVIRETKAGAGGATLTKDWAQERSVVKYVKLGGGAATARRSVVDDAKCNACHVDLGFHGTDARKGVEYCAFCHNPNNVNEERVSRFEVDPATSAQYVVTPNSVSLGDMIHKIHAGGALSSAYTLGGNPTPNAANPAGTQETFAQIFPGDLGSCQTCHKPGAFDLPAPTNLPKRVETWTCSEDPATGDTGATPARADNNFCDAVPAGQPALWAPAGPATFTPPQTAACTSCHDSAAAIFHAAQNTMPGPVETCDLCHGAGKSFDPLVVHVPRP